MKWTQQEITKLESMYGTKPIMEIVSILDRTKDAIKQKARQLGLNGNRVDMLRLVKHKHDSRGDYFEGQSLDVFYWAGFLAADGCITRDGRLHLGVATKDINHLRSFMKAIDYSGPITKTHDGCFCMIRVRNDQLVYSLQKRFGITQRKTFTLQPPKCFNTHGQEIAFAVGYIDGDGCIHKNKEGRFELSCLGTLSITKWIRGVFFPQLDTNISKRNRIYCFKITGRNAMDVIDKVRGMRLPYLRRKWRKA